MANTLFPSSACARHFEVHGILTHSSTGEKDCASYVIKINIV